MTLAIGTSNLRYDHNLLNLQPRHLESADIERQLLTKLEDSVWFAVSVCDSREELAAQKAAVRSLADGGQDRGNRIAFAGQTTAKQQAIAAIHAALCSLPAQPPPRAASALRDCASESRPGSAAPGRSNAL